MIGPLLAARHEGLRREAKGVLAVGPEVQDPIEAATAKNLHEPEGSPDVRGEPRDMNLREVSPMPRLLPRLHALEHPSGSVGHFQDLELGPAEAMRHAGVELKAG